MPSLRPWLVSWHWSRPAHCPYRPCALPLGKDIFIQLYLQNYILLSIIGRKDWVVHRCQGCIRHRLLLQIHIMNIAIVYTQIIVDKDIKSAIQIAVRFAILPKWIRLQPWQVLQAIQWIFIWWQCRMGQTACFFPGHLQDRGTRHRKWKRIKCRWKKTGWKPFHWNVFNCCKRHLQPIYEILILFRKMDLWENLRNKSRNANIQ